jgi:hypothetical protein
VAQHIRHVRVEAKQKTTDGHGLMLPGILVSRESP